MSKNKTIETQEFDLVNEEGVRLVTLNFGLTIYMSALFSENKEVIRDCYKAYLQTIGSEQLTYYASGTMRRHKPVSKRALNMLPTWLADDAPLRKDYMLELKSGEHYQAAPEFKFNVFAGEQGSSIHHNQKSNLISMSFPYSWGLDRRNDMEALFIQLCHDFPALAGHAGYSFECSRYNAEESETFAWSQSMRHPGIDISRIPQDSHAVRQDSIKTVNWLTAIRDTLIDELPTWKKQKSNFEISSGQGCTIVKCGDTPAIGDVNTGDIPALYYSLGAIVSPLVDIAAKRSVSFNIASDYVEKTESWYHRFSQK